MNDMNELSERDARLAARLRDTLERSIGAADPELQRALAAARESALAERAPRHRLRPWALASGLALAAGLTMFLVLPGTPGGMAGAPQATKAVVVEDPEMLEDMDMLQALAATPDQHARS